MTMSVELDERHQALVAQRIASGEYHDVSEVVRKALDLLESRDSDEAAKQDWLMHALAEGEASGLAEGEASDVLARIRSRHGLTQSAQG